MNNINLAVFMSSQDTKSISYKKIIELFIQKISSFNVKLIIGNS